MTFKVYDKPCDQCLFTPERVVSRERAIEIIKNCKEKDTYFVCHKASLRNQDVCCHTFYQTQDCQLMQIAQRLDKVEFVPQPKPRGE